MTRNSKVVLDLRFGVENLSAFLGVSYSIEIRMRERVRRDLVPAPNDALERFTLSGAIEIGRDHEISRRDILSSEKLE